MEFNNITGNYSLLFTDVTGEIWRTAPISYGDSCYAVIDALESLPNDVIPYGSVRCQMWSDYNNIPASDEPILTSPANEGEKHNRFYGVKYTVAFPKNPGGIAPLAIDRFLDGKRPTLFTGERNETSLGDFVYHNGFQGGELEYFTDKCAGVDVSIVMENSVLDGTRATLDLTSEYSYLGDITSFEFRLLSKCLQVSQHFFFFIFTGQLLYKLTID